jgi:transcriptional regulator with XRE-family HTH domain
VGRDERLKIIGKNVRYYRKATGITSFELGFVTGIDRSALCKIERGEINITIETLLIISDNLNIQLRDLMP